MRTRRVKTNHKSSRALLRTATLNQECACACVRVSVSGCRATDARGEGGGVPAPPLPQLGVFSPFFSDQQESAHRSDGSFQPRRSGAAYSLMPAAFSWEETGGGEKKKEKMKKKGGKEQKKNLVCVCV